ncbi:hypothetical protein OIE68_19930 [Nocardia vinacea]|uniref:hypothetical protein n=1 Tax=Nocardia vinacea TaxID=96468 RepID=UPI002E0F2CC6|nr:hypothetical protein OIE68_19930 [Nocardia vinacea]
MFASRYIIEREIGYSEVGDGRNATGDNSTVAANAFETTDGDGGAQVRRTIPEA